LTPTGDLRRLVAATEALELQVRELRAEVQELAEREGPGEPPAEPDLDAARIVALNMALDGKPRDEVAAYIRGELGVEDSGALLDDVYARVG
jgi:hypothetical protein